MRITLFEAFPDPYRESMLLFGRCLFNVLEKKMGSQETLRSYSPKFARLKPHFLRYLSQYAGYPAAAFFSQGDINHILDHSYAHLIHAMNPQKTVVTFHDAIWLKTRRDHFGAEPVKKMRWIRAFNLKALGKAARILCDSQASRRALIHYLDYPEEKIEVIPLGLHESFRKFENGPALEIPGLENGPFILHVGHTQTYKNIPALFHTLAVLKKKNYRVKLLKAGTAFTLEQEKLARDLGVWERVVHLGKVDQKLLPAVYKAADVLLQPSFDEGFGFPVLEAMACGLPVIASNRGSLPELVEDAGILTEPEDYSGMAESVCRILDQPAFRNELAEKGKRKAERYTWEQTAAKILEVYRQVFRES